MKEKNHVFLILTDSIDNGVGDFFNDFKRDCGDLGLVMLLFNQKTADLAPTLGDFDAFIFTDGILFEMGYRAIGNKLIPGNNHFPLLNFFLENSDYEYYWLIENDVRFTGDWRMFFNEFINDNRDFITSHVRNFEQEPLWQWWDTFSRAGRSIKTKYLLRSFNPIYRLSNIALSHLVKMLSNGWQGHHEVTIPSLLAANGYSILDIGGYGPFGEKADINRFYISGAERTNGAIVSGGLRWRPYIEKEEYQPNLLYHPCKNYKSV